MSEELISDYYAAFNRGDSEGLLALLTDDVVHDINQGAREIGKPAFRAFLSRMDDSYREEIVSLVVLSHPGGSRFAAEFEVLGVYGKTDPGFPEARGQRYRLPAGAFFEVRDGRIARVTNYYNVREWVAQVSAGAPA